MINNFVLMEQIVIFTDVEPDDFGTLILLFKMMKRNSHSDSKIGSHKCNTINIKTIVIGEGLEHQIKLKFCIVKKLLELYELNDKINLLCLTTTNYDWFPSLDKFKNIITETMFNNIDDKFQSIYGDQIVLDHLKDLVICNQIDAFVCIMSHEILLKLVESNDVDLKNITLYSYGSFNFRRLNNNQSKLIDHFKLYKEVHITEAYLAFGGPNSINSNSYPDFFNKKLHPPDNDAYDLYKQFIIIWNELVNSDTHNTIIYKAKKFLPTVMRRNDKIYICQLVERVKDVINGKINEKNINEQTKSELVRDLSAFERNVKVYFNTLPENGYQTVFADYLVTMVLNNILNTYKTKCYVHFKDGYTVCSNTADPSKNQVMCYIYEGIDFNNAVSILSDMFDSS